jgi:hypothetical protein
MKYADSDLRATCERCGTDCGVLESRTQATRQEPSRSLGFFAFCPECQVTFPASEPQPELEGLRPADASGILRP